MNRHLILLGSLALSGSSSAPAAVQTFYWYGALSGNWTQLSGGKTNWSLRSTARQDTSNLPDGDDTVVFSNSLATRTTVTVGGNPTIDRLAFNANATSSYTLQNSTITLNAADGTGVSVEAASASHTLSTGLVLAADQAFEIQTPAVAGSNQLLISGKISGPGRQLTKTGGGILELSNGTNDYTGGTVIAAGLLRLGNPANTSATGVGEVLVDSQGTLGGNGSLGGTVNVKGAIAPGAGIGTLHTGGQNWLTGGRYQLEINSPIGAPGDNWDLLDINGTLDLTSAAGFSIQLLPIDNAGQPAALAGFDNTLAQSWVIAQTQGITNFAPGLLSVDASGLTNDLAGGSFDLGQNGTDLLLRYSPASVPEPASLLLAAGVLLGLGRRQKPNQRPA